MPGLPRSGEEASRDISGFLTASFGTETEEPLRRFFDSDTMVLERSMTGTVIGEMLCVPATAGASFGILRVFGFRDGLVSREQIWIDSASIVAQLIAT